MRNKYMLIIPFVIFAAIAVILWRGIALDPRNLPSALIDKEVPSFQLTTLKGQQLSEKNLRGEISLLHIWATWCVSCRQEHSLLMSLAKKCQMPIYGMLYKDSASNAQQWLRHLGNPYKKLSIDEIGKVAIDLGVYGTPETFLIDKQGIIRHKYAGMLNEAIWQKQFAPLIEKLAPGTKKC